MTRFTHSLATLRFTPLACAIALAHTGALGTALVYSPSVMAEQTQQFNIQGGALNDVLARFAARSGIYVAGSSALARNKTSQGVNGRYTVDVALTILLEGTGLFAIPQSNGSYTLSTEQSYQTDGDNVQLMPMSVSDDALGRQTEGSASYTTQVMASATKLSLSAQETPQSVSVVTQQQIEDQSLATLEEALTLTPGITLRKAGLNRPNYYARGFSISNFSYDGINSSYSNFAFDNFASPDMAIYDHIEIVRGATGLLSGTGDPSASINMVRKTPTDTFQGYVKGHLGSWNNRRIETDLSGPLNESGSVRGRVVVAAQDEDHYMPDLYDNTRLFYGIIEADLTDQTQLTLSANVQNNDRGSTWYMQPYGLDRKSNINPDWARHNTENESYRLQLDHQFDNDWSVRLAATHMSAETEFVDIGHYGTLDTATGSGLYLGYPGNYYNEETQKSVDLYATGPFSLAGREHELVLGATYRTRIFTPWSAFTSDTQTIDNAYTWNNANAMDEPNWGTLTRANWDYIDHERSAYATARWNLADPVHLITGARLTSWQYKQVIGTSRYEVSDEITPFVGLVWDLNDTYAVYSSYTSIFNPQDEYDANGDLLDPITGKAYELGMKSAWLDGDLNGSVALFVIDQVNRAEDDLSGPSPCPYNTSTYCSKSSGEVRSKGVELQLNGALTPATQVSVGYTFNRVTYNSGEEKGDNFDTLLPKHMLRASLSHQLNDEWAIGGSIVTQSRIRSASDAQVQQGGYTVANVMTRWDVSDQLSLQLNLNNLFDKTYYQSLNTATNGNLYGAPRNLLLSAQYTF